MLNYRVLSTCFKMGALLVLAFSALVGCGGGTGLAPVSGTVTLDGQPLPDALVSFYPADEGRPSHGKTDASGRYELVYSDEKKGAMLGPNTVRITVSQVEGEGQPAGRPPQEKVQQGIMRNQN